MNASRSKLLVIGLVLLLAGLAAAVAYLGRITHSGPAAENHGGANGLIPDLGGRAKPMPGANDTPAGNQPANPAGNGPSNDAPDTTTDQPPADHENSVFEIDTYLSNLAHGTRVRNQRSIDLAHAALRKCRPDKLVDERVTFALTAEANAFVRTQFFAAFHQPDPKLDWARRALEQRGGKFLGTDAVYEPGEEAELAAYARLLLQSLIVQVRAPADPDARTLAFARNVLDAQRPAWALKLLLTDPLEDVLMQDIAAFARLLEQELKHLLERATAEWDLREQAFWLYALAQPDAAGLLSQMEAPFLRPHVATLLPLFGPWPVQQTFRAVPVWPLWQRLREQAAAISAMVGRVLAGNALPPEKQLLIQRLARHDVPDARQMLEAGLQRKDVNLGDYLAAWGYRAATPDDLKRLIEAAASADTASATGAIEGLRQSQLPQADIELQRLIEQGDNAGIQSQALGALLLRNSADADKLVESYLGADRDPSLRAVAVAHIAAKNTARMQRVVEEDASPRVRQAALTRLGDLKDKKLRSFFLSVAINDNSPLIRQQAKKLAEELKD